MTKLKHEQVGKEIQFTGYKQKTTKIYKEKGTINIDNAEDIIKAMQKVAKKQKKEMRIVRLYVVNGDKSASYTSMESFLDYYQGRVKDAEKFHDFFQIDITTAIED